jgi:hypothetical protein
MMLRSSQDVVKPVFWRPAYLLHQSIRGAFGFIYRRERFGFLRDTSTPPQFLEAAAAKLRVSKFPIYRHGRGGLSHRFEAALSTANDGVFFWRHRRSVCCCPRRPYDCVREKSENNPPTDDPFLAPASRPANRSVSPMTPFPKFDDDGIVLPSMRAFWMDS